ncbi:GNAT family N-acetyltransferase [Actinokineospora diospyrosa]|uniref:Acetyltransferase (GNAT) domain-containing protein n=1 Tax=Actinokineospora diospyrosa TaxID=103728 RepID=A0ABT1IJK9_9PSEU|nr:GNAT family N-acetyltransferase [Actinokineospora diospyrosa]MCP2272833.1 Acetyltransferase (GNAT) domain-containing protein [Actinokineospora diospyrosa]
MLSPGTDSRGPSTTFSGMAEAAVRAAGPDDVAELARVQVSTWQTGFENLLPPDVLAGLDADAAAAELARVLEQGPATVHVAVEGQWLVGFCVVGPSPESESAGANDVPAPDAGTVALVGTLLVEPRWGRRGHAGRLLAASCAAAADAGMTRGICWVPERSQSLVGFFQRAGWVPDGVVRTLDAGGRPLREVRLTGSLGLDLV